MSDRGEVFGAGEGATAGEPWPLTADPTRAAGLEQLEGFLPRAGRDYAATRNFDFGPDRRGNVSVLSPYTRHRLVTEEEIVARVLKRHSRSAAEKFIQEVFWRTYWKGWLEHRPSVWSDYQADVRAAAQALQTASGLRSAFEAAVTGRTGIDCFDFWAEELVETGYLHNHARMWFASIWVFTLRLPWELGADFFLRHLLDGDPASNTLSWRWVAGLHTQGKNYLARASNIAKYTDGRFELAAGLDERAGPLEAEPVPAPLAPALPPIVDPQKRTMLLLTEEDL
ncbi:MAG: FAD-binding domain-containing protein, partial [Pseudomonadota bacterium]